MLKLKRQIRRSVNRVLRPFGYELNKSTHNSLGSWDAQSAMAEHLPGLFKLLSIETVLDVGANRGQYHDFLRDRVGFRGTIYSFEPIPEHAAALRERAEKERGWEVFEYALGAENGVAEFKVYKKTGWSSLRELRPGQTQRTDAIELARAVPVQVRRLDDVLPSLTVKGGLYIKLDTQGSDMDVMRGGEGALRVAMGMQTEFECIPCYEGTATPSQVLDFLASRGFWLTAVHPLWRENDLRIGEADAVFTRVGGSGSRYDAVIYLGVAVRFAEEILPTLLQL